MPCFLFSVLLALLSISAEVGAQTQPLLAEANAVPRGRVGTLVARFNQLGYSFASNAPLNRPTLNVFRNNGMAGAGHGYGRLPITTVSTLPSSPTPGHSVTGPSTGTVVVPKGARATVPAGVPKGIPAGPVTYYVADGTIVEAQKVPRSPSLSPGTISARSSISSGTTLSCFNGGCAASRSGSVSSVSSRAVLGSVSRSSSISAVSCSVACGAGSATRASRTSAFARGIGRGLAGFGAGLTGLLFSPLTIFTVVYFVNDDVREATDSAVSCFMSAAFSGQGPDGLEDVPACANKFDNAFPESEWTPVSLNPTVTISELCGSFTDDDGNVYSGSTTAVNEVRFSDGTILHTPGNVMCLDMLSCSALPNHRYVPVNADGSPAEDTGWITRFTSNELQSNYDRDGFAFTAAAGHELHLCEECLAWDECDPGFFAPPCLPGYATRNRCFPCPAEPPVNSIFASHRPFRGGCNWECPSGTYAFMVERNLGSGIEYAPFCQRCPDGWFCERGRAMQCMTDDDAATTLPYVCPSYVMPFIDTCLVTFADTSQRNERMDCMYEFVDTFMTSDRAAADLRECRARLDLFAGCTNRYVYRQGVPGSVPDGLSRPVSLIGQVGPDIEWVVSNLSAWDENPGMTTLWATMDYECLPLNTTLPEDGDSEADLFGPWQWMSLWNPYVPVTEGYIRGAKERCVQPGNDYALCRNGCLDWVQPMSVTASDYSLTVSTPLRVFRGWGPMLGCVAVAYGETVPAGTGLQDDYSNTLFCDACVGLTNVFEGADCMRPCLWELGYKLAGIGCPFTESAFKDNGVCEGHYTRVRTTWFDLEVLHISPYTAIDMFTRLEGASVALLAEICCNRGEGTDPELGDVWGSLMFTRVEEVWNSRLWISRYTSAQTTSFVEMPLGCFVHGVEDTRFTWGLPRFDDVPYGEKFTPHVPVLRHMYSSPCREVCPRGTYVPACVGLGEQIWNYSSWASLADYTRLDECTGICPLQPNARFTEPDEDTFDTCAFTTECTGANAQCSFFEDGVDGNEVRDQFRVTLTRPVYAVMCDAFGNATIEAAGNEAWVCQYCNDSILGTWGTWDTASLYGAIDGTTVELLDNDFQAVGPLMGLEACYAHVNCSAAPAADPDCAACDDLSCDQGFFCDDTPDVCDPCAKRCVACSPRVPYQFTSAAVDYEGTQWHTWRSSWRYQDNSCDIECKPGYYMRTRLFSDGNEYPVCSPATFGQYSPGGTVTSPTRCEPGTTSIFAAGACSVCQAGFYCATGYSLRCPTGMLSLEGSDSISDCFCQPGMYPVRGVCRPCPPGFYCHGSKRTRCSATNINRIYSFLGAASVQGCRCASGATASMLGGGDYCLGCPSNSYALNGVCEPCLANQTAYQPPNTYSNFDTCSCRVGEYRVPEREDVTVARGLVVQQHVGVVRGLTILATRDQLYAMHAGRVTHIAGGGTVGLGFGSEAPNTVALIEDNIDMFLGDLIADDPLDNTETFDTTVAFTSLSFIEIRCVSPARYTSTVWVSDRDAVYVLQWTNNNLLCTLTDQSVHHTGSMRKFTSLPRFSHMAASHNGETVFGVAGGVLYATSVDSLGASSLSTLSEGTFSRCWLSDDESVVLLANEAAGSFWKVYSMIDHVVYTLQVTNTIIEPPELHDSFTGIAVYAYELSTFRMVRGTAHYEIRVSLSTGRARAEVVRLDSFREDWNFAGRFSSVQLHAYSRPVLVSAEVEEIEVVPTDILDDFVAYTELHMRGNVFSQQYGCTLCPSGTSSDLYALGIADCEAYDALGNVQETCKAMFNHYYVSADDSCRRCYDRSHCSSTTFMPPCLPGATRLQTSGCLACSLLDSVRNVVEDHVAVCGRRCRDGYYMQYAAGRVFCLRCPHDWLCNGCTVLKCLPEDQYMRTGALVCNSVQETESFCEQQFSDGPRRANCAEEFLATRGNARACLEVFRRFMSCSAKVAYATQADFAAGLSAYEDFTGNECSAESITEAGFRAGASSGAAVQCANGRCAAVDDCYVTLREESEVAVADVAVRMVPALGLWPGCNAFFQDLTGEAGAFSIGSTATYTCSLCDTSDNPANEFAQAYDCAEACGWAVGDQLIAVMCPRIQLPSGVCNQRTLRSTAFGWDRLTFNVYEALPLTMAIEGLDAAGIQGVCCQRGWDADSQYYFEIDTEDPTKITVSLDDETLLAERDDGVQLLYTSLIGLPYGCMIHRVVFANGDYYFEYALPKLDSIPRGFRLKPISVLPQPDGSHIGNVAENCRDTCTPGSYVPACAGLGLALLEKTWQSSDSHVRWDQCTGVCAELPLNQRFAEEQSEGYFACESVLCNTTSVYCANMGLFGIISRSLDIFYADNCRFTDGIEQWDCTKCPHSALGPGENYDLDTFWAPAGFNAFQSTLTMSLLRGVRDKLTVPIGVAACAEHTTCDTNKFRVAEGGCRSCSEVDCGVGFTCENSVGCTPCPSGERSGDPEYWETGTCVEACRPGFYMRTGDTSKRCRRCLRGFYCPGGTQGILECDPLDNTDERYSPAGSSSLSQCTSECTVPPEVIWPKNFYSWDTRQCDDTFTEALGLIWTLYGLEYSVSDAFELGSPGYQGLFGHPSTWGELCCGQFSVVSNLVTEHIDDIPCICANTWPAPGPFGTGSGIVPVVPRRYTCGVGEYLAVSSFLEHIRDTRIENVVYDFTCLDCPSRDSVGCRVDRYSLICNGNDDWLDYRTYANEGGILYSCDPDADSCTFRDPGALLVHRTYESGWDRTQFNADLATSPDACNMQCPGAPHLQNYVKRDGISIGECRTELCDGGCAGGETQVMDPSGLGATTGYYAAACGVISGADFTPAASEVGANGRVKFMCASCLSLFPAGTQNRHKVLFLGTKPYFNTSFTPDRWEPDGCPFRCANPYYRSGWDCLECEASCNASHYMTRCVEGTSEGVCEPCAIPSHYEPGVVDESGFEWAPLWDYVAWFDHGNFACGFTCKPGSYNGIARVGGFSVEVCRPCARGHLCPGDVAGSKTCTFYAGQSAIACTFTEQLVCADGTYAAVAAVLPVHSRHHGPHCLLGWRIR